MGTQTGGQAALFDAPTMTGQATLFGGTYLAADELDQAAELDEAAELAADIEAQARIGRQRIKANEAYAALLAHRRGCGNCIPGARPCRIGRQATTDARLSRDALRAMLAGEL